MAQNYDVLKEDEARKEETKRFYMQQKSTRAECNFGSRSCTSCLRRDECKIREFVE